MSRQYITTAIDYPNAAPHMGHVLEKVLADVCARWMRLRGDEVRFQIGTDEHGIKIQQTADKEKITPKELVDRNVPLFEDLYRRLGISSDMFIRTSDQRKHWPTVIELWKRLEKAGMLQKRTYTGLYCSGCERFLTKKDLVDGLCENHKKAPDEVKEENWFFLLSKESNWLKKLLQKEYHIIPDFREQETLSLIDRGLEDVSFSRPKSSLAWGIPVPGDEEQTMYVWCDALTNYISGLGYFTDHEEKQWWQDATVTHVIGKDIARFHALIWPAMLKAAGVRIPDQLLIHGFLTSEGQKMSKSTGNVVVPDEVLTKFLGNPDPLRFYLSHEVPVGNDGDFSWKRIEELYDSKLRNQLGNLLNRVIVLFEKKKLQLVLSEFNNWEMVDGLLGLDFLEYVQDGWPYFETEMNAISFHSALVHIDTMIEHANFLIESQKAWDPSFNEEMYKKHWDSKLELLLSILAELLRHISLMLLPFMPETAQKMTMQLGVPYAEKMLQKDFTITKALREFGGAKGWKKIGTPAILFAPLS